MKAQHTQKRWTFDGEDSVYIPGAEIAYVRSWDKEDVRQGTVERVISPQEQKANGRLMASAPELYQACQEALYQMQSCLGDLTDAFEIKRTKRTIKFLKTIIKKAEAV